MQRGRTPAETTMFFVVQPKADRREQVRSSALGTFALAGCWALDRWGLQSSGHLLRVIEC